MGWWGAGVFDGDEPREYLNDVIERFEKAIDRFLAGDLSDLPEMLQLYAEPVALIDSCVIPTLAIIIALHETLKCEYLPSLQTTQRWKEQCLRTFDEDIDYYDIPSHKAERRRVIVELFDRLIARTSSG